jgi:hypothetical protein
MKKDSSGVITGTGTRITKRNKKKKESSMLF